MPIFKTAYETTCGNRQLNVIKEKIKIAKIKDVLEPTAIKEIKLINWNGPATDNIEFFLHPLWMDDVLYVDVRNYTRKSTDGNTENNVRNRPEYDWTINRAILNKIWLDDRYGALRDISILPAKLYSALLSETISRKYALDPAEQLHIAVLSAFFYYGLFRSDHDIDELEHQRNVKNIAQATMVPPTKVDELIQGLSVISNLEQFCKVIIERTQSVRLQDFNVGILAAIVGPTWFGTNSRENICVGLEHPPTWLAICNACVNDATFKRSSLAKLTERLNKGPIGQQFNAGIRDMISFELDQ